MSDTRELEARLRVQAGHHDCEDCWYSCATLTCNDSRRSDKCDCGADETNALHKEAADALAAMRAEIAGLRAYALALKDATLPFCAIRANDNDNFNGYAPETVIRCEITVGELVKLRLCAGCGQPQAGCFVNSTPLPAAPK